MTAEVVCADLDVHFARHERRCLDVLRLLRDADPDAFHRAPLLVALDEDTGDEAKQRFHARWQQVAGERRVLVEVEAAPGVAVD